LKFLHYIPFALFRCTSGRSRRCTV